jgi:hypothetical protein
MRALAAALVLGALLVAAPAAAAQTGDPEYDQAFSLGGQAYRYGFPLMEFVRVRAEETSVPAPNRKGDAPVNTFSNADKFARPSNRTVVAPNVDTLYSISHLDLGKGPVVLEHPDMGRRYFTFELLDPYTNVIGYVGSRTTGERAERFAISWTKRPGRRVPGVRTITSQYRRVWVIGRTLAEDKPGDLRRARKLQDRYALVPLNRLDNPPAPPSVQAHVKPHQPVVPDGLEWYDALGDALAENPPPARDQPLLDQLAQVGIGPERHPSQEGLPQPVLDGLTAGFAQARSALSNNARAKALQKALAGGGWAPVPDDLGDYGTDYDTRAEIAVVGLGANTIQEATYPTALADKTGALLDGTKRYRIVFPRGQTPPNRAFWSLTMYTLDGFLVPNAAHRYAIGSTHPPLVKEDDGSVIVAIQHDRPAAKHVNWLPAPAGPFRMSLRIYRPTAAVLGGSWKPPPIEPVNR